MELTLRKKSKDYQLLPGVDSSGYKLHSLSKLILHNSPKRSLPTSFCLIVKLKILKITWRCECQELSCCTGIVMVVLYSVFPNWKTKHKEEFVALLICDGSSWELSKFKFNLPWRAWPLAEGISGTLREMQVNLQNSRKLHLSTTGVRRPEYISSFTGVRRPQYFPYIVNEDFKYTEVFPDHIGAFIIACRPACMIKKTLSLLVIIIHHHYVVNMDCIGYSLCFVMCWSLCSRVWRLNALSQLSISITCNQEKGQKMFLAQKTILVWASWRSMTTAIQTIGCAALMSHPSEETGLTYFRCWAHQFDLAYLLE